MKNRPWVQNYDPDVSPNLEYPEIPLSTILEEAAFSIPEQICLVYLNYSYSFRDIYNASEKVAKFLVARGIQKGDRVGIILPNSPDFIIAFFGILKAGGVVVAINPKFKRAEIEYVINDSEIGVLFLQKSTSITMLDDRERITPLLRIICPVDPGSFENNLWQENEIQHKYEYSLHEVLSSDTRIHRLPDLGPEDPAIFQYSGGTTGIPKAAIGLHRNLIANIYQFYAWLKGIEGEKEVFLSVIPLYHVYGMVLTMCLAIKMKSTQVLLPNPQDINGILQAIKFHKVTIFPSVPNMFSAILNSKQSLEDQISFDNLKVCISGSAPLDRIIKNDFESKTGSRIVEGYGLSEAPTATHCNPVKGINKPGSIGMPLPDVDCRIVDLETGTYDVDYGDRGELILRGPQVMIGYHKREDETKITIKEGWLYTGDIAYADEDGYFFIAGRIKDLIKVSGFQVWPREIEEIILKFPGIKEATVAGIKNTETGERPKAWIILKDNYSIDIGELRVYCRKFLADYKVPLEFEIIKEFPRTTVGKILRRELVRLDEEKNHPGD